MTGGRCPKSPLLAKGLNISIPHAYTPLQIDAPVLVCVLLAMHCMEESRLSTLLRETPCELKSESIRPGTPISGCHKAPETCPEV